MTETETTKREDTVAELAEKVAEVWRANGMCGVSYSTVAAHTKRSRAGLQRYFPNSIDFMRAGAMALVKDGGDEVVLTSSQLADLVTSTASLETVAVFEAHCWLSRNGE